MGCGAIFACGPTGLLLTLDMLVIKFTSGEPEKFLPLPTLKRDRYQSDNWDTPSGKLGHQPVNRDSKRRAQSLYCAVSRRNRATAHKGMRPTALRIGQRPLGTR